MLRHEGEKAESNNDPEVCDVLPSQGRPAVVSYVVLGLTPPLPPCPYYRC